MPCCQHGVARQPLKTGESVIVGGQAGLIFGWVINRHYALQYTFV